MERHELLDDRSKLRGKELVSFIHDECRAFGEISDALAGQVQNSTRSANKDMNGIVQTNDIVH